MNGTCSPSGVGSRERVRAEEDEEGGGLLVGARSSGKWHPQSARMPGSDRYWSVMAEGWKKEVLLPVLRL